MSGKVVRSSRRTFLQASSAVAGSLAALRVAQGAHVGGNSLLKVGLIGCGGRGSGAALQALHADAEVKLWAMGDAFEDRLESSLRSLSANEAIGGKIDVPPERRFVGFDAYKQVIAECDVVLLCSPPGFRHLHLRSAIDASKHVFAEKPVAVDAPGVRSVLESSASAKAKGLSIVSGLCLRYDDGYRETVRRIHDGQIGKVLALEANDYRGTIWVKPRQPEWSDMTWQMRNWYYFAWLSGDFNVEQHVHELDVCAWIMQNQYPVRAVGMGGRQVRTAPEFGHIYDHFSVVYEYADGTKLSSNCRQQAGCANNISNVVTGSRGTAWLSEKKNGLTIKSDATQWTYAGETNEMYQAEHDALFASIRSGRPINHGEYMAHSTLLAIMGRMAAYTGQVITWEMALNSQEDLSPPRYDWNVAMPVPVVARPGSTKFI